MATTQLTSENFKQVIEGNSIVIIDYWAPWCGPCRAFAPVFEKVAAKHPNITFAKVNTEEQQELAAAFSIRSIPTLMVFRDQILIFSQPGMLPEKVLEDLVSKVEALDMDHVRRQIEQEEAKAQPAAAQAS